MYKKLYRSNREKMLGGVAAGLAEYFDIDPTIVRIAFVVTIFFHGSGLLAYLLLWIIVPERPIIFASSESTGDENPGAETSSSEGEKYDPVKNYYDQKEEKSNKRTRIAAFVLIAIGALFLLDNFIPRFFVGDLWPVILIAIGAGLLMNSDKKEVVK